MNVYRFLALSFAAFALTWRIEAQEGLVGRGVLTFSFLRIKVYEVEHHRPNPGSTFLRLRYLVDVSKERSAQGWDAGLGEWVAKDPASLVSRLEWLKANTPDMPRGSTLEIHVQGDEVRLVKDGRELARRRDPLLASMALAPWIGERPVDPELKAKLLGGT